MTRLIPSPRLAGMFSHPCGAWVSLYRFNSGYGWFRPLASVTRVGVLTSERSN